MSLNIVKSLTTRAVMAPLIRPITTAVGSIPAAPLVLLELETTQGVIGRSYLFGYTPLALKPLCALLQNISETMVGKTVDPASRFAELELMFLLLGRQGLVGMAIAGLDMALWDVLGQEQSLPVSTLLGAGKASSTCYDSFGMIDGTRDRNALEGSKKSGFSALKIKIGGTFEEDRRAVSDLREIVGNDVQIMVDYNQSLSVPEAIRRITRLEEEFDLTWIEEPVLAEDLSGHRTVRDNVRTPIQTGENWWMPDDVARATQVGASDHAMLDIMKIGGITGWMRAAAIAQGASLPVSSHLFIEASAHVMAATPNTYLLEHLDVASTVLKDPYEIMEGSITPKGPGLGIAWDESAVDRYAL